MKLAVIILNYNDRPHTEKLARKVAGFSLVSLVVIVDNQSTDGSGEELADYFRHAGKVAVIRTSRNGGYGYGNNAGLRYACGQGCTHMLIANPDTDFTEDMLRKLCEVFVKKRDAGVVSAMMLDSQHGLQQTAWPLRSFTQDLINAGRLRGGCSGGASIIRRANFGVVLICRKILVIRKIKRSTGIKSFIRCGSVSCMVRFL